MAKSGQNDFQHSVIDVVSAPIYERNFVRIMAMMAVPPDGIIYAVMPKNGLKPSVLELYAYRLSRSSHINGYRTKKGVKNSDNFRL